MRAPAVAYGHRSAMGSGEVQKHQPTVTLYDATYITIALVVFLAALGAIIVWCAEANAHDAMPTASKPQGWSYPFSCCSGYDCREVGTTRKGAGTEGIVIAEKPEGYVISTTHEVINYGDTRLKDSPDGQFHWCSVAGSVVGRTICLFVPPRSY